MEEIRKQYFLLLTYFYVKVDSSLKYSVLWHSFQEYIVVEVQFVPLSKGNFMDKHLNWKG